MNLQTLKLLPHRNSDPADWNKVHINLRVLAYETIQYCETRHLPLVITSIIRPMIKGISKTDIHSKGRAFDMSVKGWAVEQCVDFETWMNDNYSDKFGAISATTGKPRACLYHNGTGMHLHLQVRP